MIVGFDTSDDALVYKVRDDLAVVQTVDFFPPIVDDPYTFGQIAAANSLSDIYAMGGDPTLSMNLICFPTCLPMDIMAKIMQGGADKVKEAGAIIAGGHTIEENVEGVQKLCAAGIDVLELNISCPNVKQGGLAFGIRAKDAEEVVSAVRKVCTVPLVVKLSPQAESIPDMCKAVEAAGADGISLCNTFQACAIDLEKRRPVFNNTFAGLSGPAIRPIALRMVWQAVGAVNIPVIGLGGILTGRDALEFIMAGAAAVQVGTANFLDPKACTRITAEIGEWMDAHGVKTLDEIRGCARG